MKQKIWLISDSDEPKDGPLWSARVRILVEEAKRLGIPVLHCNILDVDTTSIAPHDILLYRHTEQGIFRDAFLSKVMSCSKGFIPNHKASNVGTKSHFWSTATELTLPIPTTWSRTEFLEQKKESEFGFVIKISRSSQGVGVFRCLSYQEACACIHTVHEEIIVQEFIPLPQIQDHRVLMVGTKVVAVMKRVLNAGVEGEFRANLSLGTSHAQEDILPEAVHKDMIRLIEFTNLDFVGIDYLYVDGRHLFLECNIYPGLLGISEFLPTTPQKVLHALLWRARNS